MPRSVMGDNNSLVLMMAFSMNVFMSSEIGSIPGIFRNLKADILNDFLKLSKVDFNMVKLLHLQQKYEIIMVYIFMFWF